MAMQGANNIAKTLLLP